MLPIDPDPESSPGAAAAPAGMTPPVSEVGIKPFSDRSSGLLAFVVIAGLIAGMVSSFAGELIVRHYQSDLTPALRAHPNSEDMQRLITARFQSAVLTYATLGGCLGLAMGLAGGIARRAASATAAILGLSLGAAAAAATAYLAVPFFFNRYDPHSGDLLFPLLTHGAIWAAAGAIGGLAFGLGQGGQGRWKTTMVGGLAGAAAATIVYELVGALAFVSSGTELPLSSSMTTRAMAQLLVAILSAAGAVLLSHLPTTRARASSTPK